MIKDFTILIIVFLFGIFLISGQSRAWVSQSENTVTSDMPCCNHSTQQEKELCEKKCCQDKKDGSAPCSGQCENNSCQSSSHSFSATPPFIQTNDEKMTGENEKLSTPYQQPYYSLGHHSIWQLPKIS